MSQRNFQPKVKRLEQIRIDFDESLPQKINSKKVYDCGPTNNRRLKPDGLNKGCLMMPGDDDRNTKLVIPGQAQQKQSTITKMAKFYAAKKQLESEKQNQDAKDTKESSGDA